MSGRWRMRLMRTLVVGLGLAALPAGFAVQAQAAVQPCTTRTVSQPFLPWVDTHDYFLAPSGTFESGATGWTTSSGVSTVSENEPWNVSGPGTRSLRIPSGGSAGTPELCVGSYENTVRFFVKRPAGLGSYLVVSIKVTNPVTGYVWSTNTYIQSSQTAGWAVSSPVHLPAPQLTGTQDTQNLQVTFTAQGPGAWQIDDVYVDPFRTK